MKRIVATLVAGVVLAIFNAGIANADKASAPRQSAHTATDKIGTREMERRNIDLVTRFFARWSVSYAELRQSYLDAFTEDCLFQQTAQPDLIGGPATVRFLDKYHAINGFETVDVKIHTRFTQGPFVIIERTDYIRDKFGKTIFTFPCVGIMEIRGGKIVSWRDYADSADYSPRSHPHRWKFNKEIKL